MIHCACIKTPKLLGISAKPVPAMAAPFHLNGMVLNQMVGFRKKFMQLILALPSPRVWTSQVKFETTL